MDTDPVANGRRIYLGNILYHVTPDQIEILLAEGGFPKFRQIHISVDPVSGRNPGYCFVDFEDKATADLAVSTLQGSIEGRTVRVGPCEPKKSRSRADGFQRWGPWKRDTAEESGRGEGDNDGPNRAADHHSRVLTDKESRRVYIGGLGKMIDQDQNQDEIRGLLEGFNPFAIGKRITAHESVRDKPGNHNFCFVDFETADEARRAVAALDNRLHQGTHLRVNIAKQKLLPNGSRLNSETDNWRRGNSASYGSERQPRQSRQDDRGQARKPDQDQERASKSTNWRRRDA